MHFKVIPRQDTVLVFDDGDPLNYVASCQVWKYGDKGIMHTINGNRFYELMAELGGDVLERLGVETLEGYVTPAHARLMRIALKRVATVSVAHRGRMAGHDMVWVVIRPSGTIVDLLLEHLPDETVNIRGKG